MPSARKTHPHMQAARYCLVCTFYKQNSEDLRYPGAFQFYLHEDGVRKTSPPLACFSRSEATDVLLFRGDIWVGPRLAALITPISLFIPSIVSN